ncbi:MAG: lamin tail domain-containing protein, partial [Planctomycetes bacterium]|nr:lamin tail domain-containing protein [Planctomycetota bacterium]
YYTLDGTDPRLPGGAVNTDHVVEYTGPITLDESTLVKSRVYDNGQWSALNEATYYIDLAPSVRITELMYNPAEPTQQEIAAGFTNNDDFEFVELTNIGTQTLPLGGLRFTDAIDFTFPNVSLAPGQYVVVAANPDAFAERYPGFSGTVLGPYTGRFNNGGEKVRLDSPIGGIIHEFSYKDGWYYQTDGEGFSLTIRDPSEDLGLWDDADGWRSSAAPGGSPGASDSLPPPGAVIINEVLAHSDLPGGDAIELRNTTDQPIDVGGWFLSDRKSDGAGNSLLTKYQIPTGSPSETTIPAGGYLVFHGDSSFGAAFQLSEHGDELYLSSNAGGVAGGYREHVDFGASPTNVPFGLYTKSTGGTDFTLLNRLTLGATNARPYMEDLVFSELMYHPDDPTDDEIAAGFTDCDQFEFIEIHNTSTSKTYDLRDFYVYNGVGFSFGWYDADDFGHESRTLEPGATATWTATLAAGPQTYEVFARWDVLDALGQKRKLDGKARYAITHANGTTEVIRDQSPEDDDEGPDYMDPDGWVSLGTYEFDGTGQVVLTRGTNDPTNWTIADQVKFVGPTETVVVDDPVLESFSMDPARASLAQLGPGQYVVLVSDYDAFDYRYHVAANGIPVAGQYTGQLANNGEKVKLLRLGNPEHNGYLPYYRVDYVNYDDKSPWPSEPDGTGYSLIRSDETAYGNDPANWAAGGYAGTPGEANSLLDTTPPTVPADLDAIVVLNPDAQVELTWTASTDSDSYVAYYAVYRDGEQIGTSETNSFYDGDVAAGVSHVYQVSAVNRDHIASDPSAELTYAVPGVTFSDMPADTTVRLTFSEPLEQASAEDPANYTFSGGAVSAASLVEPDTVELTVPAMSSGQAYTVTVGALTTAAGTPVPSGQEISFNYYANGSGSILREFWLGIAGNAVTNLTSNANYPDNPARRNFPGAFESPLNWADKYGTRMRGYVHPPATGWYTFWIASDDNSVLYLSSDENPDNKQPIASVSSHTAYRAWDTYPSQKSQPVYLAVGKRYYIEAIQKEGGGGDHISVAWQRQGGDFQGPIPGAFLSPYVIPDLDNTPPAAPSNVQAQPVSSTSITVSWDPAEDAESGVTKYIVYRNGREIATTTATNFTDKWLNQQQSYTYAVAAINGDKFQGPTAGPPAAVKPLTGLADVQATSSTSVLVTFGKNVTQATAEVVGNYSLTDSNGLAEPITSATWNSSNHAQVTLTLGHDLVAGDIYTLAVSGVQDEAGYAMEPNAALEVVYGGVDPDLLGWWTFDVNSSAYVQDLSGHNRRLSVYGADWTGSGRIGGAYRFDGSPGDYLLDADAENYINGKSAFTFAAWIKADSVGSNRGIYYLRQPDGTDQYGFRHDSKLDNQSSQYRGFRGGIRTTGGTQRWESPGEVQTTDWQHIAITWSSGHNIQVYLDGQLVSPGWIGGAKTGKITGTQLLMIGRGSQDANRSWKGLIDDVRIYKRALNQTEIAALIDAAPVAQDDSYEAISNGTLSADVADGVLANDFDPVPGPSSLTAELVTDVQHGTLNLAADGSFTYTPAAGYTGPDGFTYRAYDGQDYSDQATVDINVVDAVRILKSQVPDASHVYLTFSTDLEESSAEDLANYALDGGLTINSATLEDDHRTVTLVLATPMTANQAYTLTVNNVTDGQGNYIAPDTQVNVQYTTWSGSDIGAVAAAGSFSEQEGTITVNGSGTDIWANSDEFYYVYQPFSGNVVLTARVVSVENTYVWAKAGVMIREDLSPTSPHASVYVTPARGVAYQRRLVANQQSYNTSYSGPTAPYWVRVSRIGNSFSAYRSPDGLNWTLMAANTIPMDEQVYIGLAVTSHVDGTLCQAVFDNVSVTIPDTTPPTADVVNVTPDPRITAVDSIDIVFSEPVVGLDVADLSLTRDGGANLLSGSETLTTTDDVTWTLGGLAGLTGQDGEYRLTLTADGSGIQNGSGVPLILDATESWTTDTNAPTAEILQVSPDPRTEPVNQLTIVFSEPVYGLDISDLSLIRNGGENLLTGSETLTTTDNVTWVLSGLADLTGIPGGGGGFVAYNDHIRGAQTAANTTSYSAKPDQTPSGLLKDIDTGQDTNVILTVTENGVRFADTQGYPAAGTDAYNIFHGYVDLSSGTGASLEVAGNDFYTYTFSNLDTSQGVTYTFHGTAVRGRSIYTDRWTKVTLQGAESATPAHSTGDGVIILSDTQVAIWTGYNAGANQGYVACWTDIDPGNDGEFAVVSQQYTGAIPTSIDADGVANGSKGYGISGIRLEEVRPGGLSGSYVLALPAQDSGIHDAAGNPLAGDAEETWVTDTIAPTADIADVGPDPRTTPVDSVDIVFDEPVTGLDISDLSLTRDGGANLLTGSETLTTSDNVTWTLGGLAGLTAPGGTYVLTLTAMGSDIRDTVGNLLAADASDTWVTNDLPPTADVTDVAPDPRNSSVDAIDIVFSEPVTGLDISDLSLTRDGGANLLTGSETLSTSDNVTWTLGGLGSLTAQDGSYTLTLTADGSGITDQTGNPLAGDAADTWTTDMQTPTITVDPLSTYDTTPTITGTVDDPEADITVRIDGNDYTAANLQNGTWTVTVGPLARGIYDVQAFAADPAGNTGTDETTDELDILTPYVAARHVFYNNSAWDGLDTAANAGDDDAIAPDKTALLPGQTATFANYTSFSKGVNGIMVDVMGLPATPTESDFIFRAGNTQDPSTWQAAPAPQEITVRPGDGDGGSDRVTITWADGAIAKEWLQV